MVNYVVIRKNGESSESIVNTTYGICDQEFETITYGATDMLKNYVLSMGIRGVSGVVGLNAILEISKSITLNFFEDVIIIR